MASNNPSTSGDFNANRLRDYGGLNIGYVAELFEEGAEEPPPAAPRRPSANGAHANPDQIPQSLSPGDAQSFHRLLSYVAAIRDYGYRIANVDPLGMQSYEEPLLEPATHGVTSQTLGAPASELVALLDETHPIGIGSTAGELISQLKERYCGSIGYEFAHVRSLEERTWLRREVETGDRVFLSDEQKLNLLELLTRAETFEQFLHKAYPSQRWYSLEGLEAMIVLMDQIVLQASFTDVKNLVVGMAHRGRLNVLAHIFGKPYADIISEFSEGHFTQLATLEASGWMTDVKYHQGARLERDVDGDGKSDVRLHLLPNPSHLEMVDPVVVGAVRAMQDRVNGGRNWAESMGLIVHGDAAFAGQGVVAETFNLAQLPGYSTGGTIHLISNNQLGFTTEPIDSYSTEHASDLARGYDIPVVHVNADDIDACVAVAKLAVAYREKFHKDFLIDLVGYRRFGHNEVDEPSFTQPVMYRQIEKHPTVRSSWSDRLVSEKLITSENTDSMQSDLLENLLNCKEKIDSESGERPEAPPDLGLSRNGFHGLEHAESAVDLGTLKEINSLISKAPQGFTPHPTVARLLRRRATALKEGSRIDWGHAEALAIGSILNDGHSVRLTGQDVRRGTFSHRHAVLFDYETGDPWVALDGYGGDSRLWINNSPLSEVATVGFEQGYSVTSTDALVIWEAQFGDFVNNAQSVVDELVVSAQAKWNQPSGLVLLLPHGYEGQGPNHSHAHIERFLALAAKNNIRVAYPTTAGQYFHLLRSQSAMLREEPLPLVVMTGKSLLRHPLAGASAKHLTSGGFRPVIRYQKPGTKLDSVKKVIFCTGKVFVDLVSHKEFENVDGISIIRFEELYPFPEQALKRELKKLPNAEEFIWLQEEPQNRGARSFMRPRLERYLPDGAKLRYVGRPATPSPAEGSHWLHSMQQDHLIGVALGVQQPVSAFV